MLVRFGRLRSFLKAETKDYEMAVTELSLEKFRPHHSVRSSRECSHRLGHNNFSIIVQMYHRLHLGPGIGNQPGFCKSDPWLLRYGRFCAGQLRLPCTVRANACFGYFLGWECANSTIVHVQSNFGGPNGSRTRETTQREPHNR